MTQNQNKNKTREHIPFRLIRTPCCHHLLCWINPRLPTYCPECGTFILSQLRPDVEGNILRSTAGWLELPNYHAQAKGQDVT